MPRIQTSDHVAHYFGTLWYYDKTKPKKIGTGTLCDSTRTAGHALGIWICGGKKLRASKYAGAYTLDCANKDLWGLCANS